MMFKTDAVKTFWLSVQFFSQLPTPQYDRVTNREMAAAMAWAPVVGLILGLGLAILLLSSGGLSALGLSNGVIGAVILAFWIGFSKGLHLDGVADFGDAWMGAFGNQQRALSIMKDSRLGTGGVIALFLVLLLKWQLLVMMVDIAVQLKTVIAAVLVILVPMLARLMSLSLLSALPYAGLSKHHKPLFAYWSSNRLPKQTVFLFFSYVLLLNLLLFIGFLFQVSFLLMALAIVLLALILFMFFALIKLQCVRLIGGINGDLVGAIIEFAEVLGLLLVLIFLKQIV